MTDFEEMEELFGGFSWMFGVIVVLFIIVFVAVLVSIIVGIVKRNGRNNNMTKNAPPPPVPPAPQRKARRDVDPFGLTENSDAPFADFDRATASFVPSAVIAATQTEDPQTEDPSKADEEPAFCPFCGALREDGKFCPFCGNKYE